MHSNTDTHIYRNTEGYTTGRVDTHKHTESHRHRHTDTHRVTKLYTDRSTEAHTEVHPYTGRHPQTHRSRRVRHIQNHTCRFAQAETQAQGHTDTQAEMQSRHSMDCGARIPIFNHHILLLPRSHHDVPEHLTLASLKSCLPSRGHTRDRDQHLTFKQNPGVLIFCTPFMEIP